MGLVYHYTSPEAALSILRDKKLWFTDCEYLNDPEELSYCQQLYKRAWIEVCRELGEPEPPIVRDLTCCPSPYEAELYIGEEATVSARYYTMCFCRESESAGMLANYASRSGKAAYVLGIDEDALTAELRALSDQLGCRGVHFKVLQGDMCYDSERAYSQIKKMVREFLEKDRLLDHRDVFNLDYIEQSVAIRERLSEFLDDVAPFVKRSSFKYEQEYRIVLCLWTAGRTNCQRNELGEGGNVAVRYRIGPTGIITPYVEVNLGEILTGIVKEVCVASRDDSQAACGGLRRLLHAEGYGPTRVESLNGMPRW